MPDSPSVPNTAPARFGSGPQVHSALAAIGQGQRAATDLLAALTSYGAALQGAETLRAFKAMAARDAAAPGASDRRDSLRGMGEGLHDCALRLDDLAKTVRMVECHSSTARVVETACGDTTFSDQMRTLGVRGRAAHSALRSDHAALARLISRAVATCPAAQTTRPGSARMAALEAEAHGTDRDRRALAALAERFERRAAAGGDDLNALGRDLNAAEADAVKLLALATRLSERAAPVQPGGGTGDDPQGGDDMAPLPDMLDRLAQASATLAEVETEMQLAVMNALLRAVRLGDAGAGMKVVAQQFGELTQSCTGLRRDIGRSLAQIRDLAAAVKPADADPGAPTDMAAIDDLQRLAGDLRAAAGSVLRDGAGLQARLARSRSAIRGLRGDASVAPLTDAQPQRRATG